MGGGICYWSTCLTGRYVLWGDMIYGRICLAGGYVLWVTCFMGEHVLKEVISYKRTFVI